MTAVTTVSILKKLRSIFEKYPIIKGMISYGTLWPTACLIQQTAIEGKKFENVDWKSCLKYSIFGGLYTAPTAYIWIRFANVVFPKTTLKTGFKKAVVDQFVYGPFSISSFYIGMTLLEGKSLDEAIIELKSKFFETWKVGAPVWLTLQTINFTFVPQPNRIVYLSVCSLMWSTFLAYMKEGDRQLLLQPSSIITNTIVNCEENVKLNLDAKNSSIEPIEP